MTSDETRTALLAVQVCLKMRTLIPGIPPPIIMISGKASTNDVIKGLQAGSCDYITKPFQPQEVLARVETQLRLYMGEVQQLQETAERNMELLMQVGAMRAARVCADCLFCFDSHTPASPGAATSRAGLAQGRDAHPRGEVLRCVCAHGRRGQL